MDNRELLEYIRMVALEIQPKLLSKPGHSKRNAYAHIFLVVKILCKTSYDIADSKKVVAIVEAIRENPNGSSEEIFLCAKRLYKMGQENNVEI